MNYSFIISFKGIENARCTGIINIKNEIVSINSKSHKILNILEGSIIGILIFFNSLK